MSILVDDGLVLFKSNEEMINKMCYIYNEQLGMLRFKIDEVVAVSNYKEIIYKLASVSLVLRKKIKYAIILKKMCKKFKINLKLKTTKKEKVIFNEPYYSKDYYSVFSPIDKINTDLISFTQEEAKKIYKTKKNDIDQYLKSICILN